MSMNSDDALDAEAVALSKVISILGTLQSEAQQRILRYAADRFKTTNLISLTAQSSPIAVLGAAAAGQTEYADVGQLLEAAQPSTGVMRALVVGYWFQICQKQQNFTGQIVNDELKALGHQSKNITSDMTNLKDRKPALIQQVGKSGKAQQARKDYRLTAAGVKTVAGMLSGGMVEERE